MKKGHLLKPVQSKMPGVEKRTNRRAGTSCLVQRHSSDPGMFVLYFGKEYVLIPAVDLSSTVQMA